MTIEQEITDFCFGKWGAKTYEGLANKLSEETGEVCGAVVKIPEGRSTEEQLEDEIGDVLIVVAQFAAMRNTTIDTLLQDRFQHIVERSKKVGCAACDRGDFQIGHHHNCPNK